MTGMIDSALRQRFLQGMSHAACTVNVVTTDGPAGRAGVTVSAMASVSADTPLPSLLVCVHHMSPAAAAIIENGVFCVNVLRDDQSYISDTFAGRLKTADGDKFSCTRWATQTTGAPRVVDPLVAFDCKLTDHMRVGTHHVFFGQVADLFVADKGMPLIFANRAYGTSVPLDINFSRPAGPDEATETLALGCFQTFGPYMVPGLLARLVKDRPGVGLRLIEGDQRRVLESLRSGETELALLYDLDLGDGLDIEHMSELKPYVLLAEGHPLADSASLSLADLATEPMVLLNMPPSRDYFLSLFADQGLEPVVAYQSASFEMVRGLVGHGLGYSLLATKPANNVTYDGHALISRPLAANAPGSRVVLACLAGAEPSPAARAFTNHCRSFFNA